MSDAFFISKAPGIARKLMDDFNLTLLEACAILGNLGHESGGFKSLQEKAPTVAGSRGGYGYAQWTGPRRRAYEAYCARSGLDPASEKANYAFLFVELTTTEKAAIPALKAAAPNMRAKVVAFELAFERAGVKHYDSRVVWAEKAVRACVAAGLDKPGSPKPEAPKPTPAPVPAPKPVPEAAPVAGGIAAVIAGFLHSVEVGLMVIGAVTVIAGIGYLIYRLRK